MTHEASIALLIDADNCPAGKIEEFIDELAKYGVINIRRAYGNGKTRASRPGSQCFTITQSSIF